MIELKSNKEIEAMRRAGQVVAECHRAIAGIIRPGVTTMEINRLVESIMESRGARPYQIGYNGYPYATCASVNDVIAHGFPSDAPLREGDIVTIDMVAELDGWLGDSAWTYAVGQVSPAAERLMRVTRECLELGIAQAKAGNRIGDIAGAIQQHAERHGYGVVRDLLAHGIGRRLHEQPLYSHADEPGTGPLLQEGMVLTIEPMITEGSHLVFIDEDGWTARTLDGRLAAQYEHVVAVTADGPEILTAQ